MTLIKAISVSAALLLSACVSTERAPTAPISSVRAVELANAAAPQAVPGVFLIDVKATDPKSDVTYLSSELDYRDQRNLGVVILADAVEQLKEKFGSHPADALRGRKILVTGEASRVTIRFFQGGIPTNNYYYQTQIRVTDASQIELASSDS